MQVAGDPQTVKINLMRHQCTEISSGKYKKRKSFVKQKQPSHKNVVQENPRVSSYNKKTFDPRNVHTNKDRCSRCGNSTHVEDFSALQRNFSVKFAISLDILLVFATKRSKHNSSLKGQRPINYKQGECMHNRKSYVATLKITVPVMIPTACRSRCSAHKPV